MGYIVETSDAPANRSTTYSLTVGDFFSGVATSGNDDWVKVDMVAGQDYAIGLVGTGAMEVGLDDTYLTLYDQNGQQIAVDDDGGPSLNSTIIHTAGYTGSYYVSIKGYDSSNTGTYKLSFFDGTLPTYDYEMGAGALLATRLSWASAATQPATLNWAFRSTGTEPNFSTATPAQRTVVSSILSDLAAATGLTLNQVNPSGTSDNATILVGGYSQNDGIGAYAYLPGSTAYSNFAGDVWLNNNSVSGTSLPYGSYDYFVLIHELGHAFGLNHPGDYDASTGPITYVDDAQFVSDTHQYTVMSYFEEGITTTDVGVYPQTYMLYDYYALHELYGTSTAFHSGNTTYGFNATVGGPYNWATNSSPLMSIYDGSGTDTIDLSGYTGSQMLNLNQGSFSNIAGYTANVSIAFHAQIENAIGGSGADTIYGNELANAVYGLNGNDSLFGGAGNDNLYGNLNHDTIYGGAGSDVIRTGWGNDRVYAEDGNDTVYGYRGHDWIYGGAGNDSLIGDRGRDVLNGGTGNDYLHGGADNDFLAGEEGDDTIIGGDGDDSLFGFIGDDELHGWSGNDFINGGDGNDFLAGNDGNDSLNGMVGNDQLFGGDGADVLDGGDGDDLLRGGLGVDQFIFNSGRDRIGDMTDNVDTIQLDRSTLGLSGWTVQDVVNLAASQTDGLFFDFGNGNTLFVVDWVDASGLNNDLIFI